MDHLELPGAGHVPGEGVLQAGHGPCLSLHRAVTESTVWRTWYNVTQQMKQQTYSERITKYVVQVLYFSSFCFVEFCFL